jgi:hypothetical protein
VVVGGFGGGPCPACGSAGGVAGFAAGCRAGALRRGAGVPARAVSRRACSICSRCSGDIIGSISTIMRRIAVSASMCRRMPVSAIIRTCMSIIRAIIEGSWPARAESVM